MQQQGGEIRRLDRAPGERYQASTGGTRGPETTGPSRARRYARGVVVALGTAVVTFAVTTFPIEPGLLVIGLAGGWLTGLAIAVGRRGDGSSGLAFRRAVSAGLIAAAGLALGLFADSLRAYAIGGVLLPWEYLLARFGWIAPASIVLAGLSGALRGR